MQFDKDRLALSLLFTFNLCTHAGQFEGCQLLAMAAIGNTKAVNELLDNGAPIDALSEHNDTALHIAALRGHTDTVRALLHRGAAVDSMAPSTTTPLMYALSNNHPQVAKLLLEHGASTSTLDGCGQTALHIVLWKHPESHACILVKLILRQGAYVDIQNKTGFRPLDIATQKYQATISHLLLNYDTELTENPPMPSSFTNVFKRAWRTHLTAMRDNRLRALKQWHQHLVNKEQLPRDIANLVLECTLPRSHITKLHSLSTD